MTHRRQTIGQPVRSLRLEVYRHRETLADLTREDGSSRVHDDLVQSIRDGSSQQRCGGGTRIIRKRTPE